MRIALCIPSGDMVMAETAMRLPELVIRTGQGHKVGLLNIRSSNPAENLNAMFRQAVTDLDAEFVVTLDADMAVPGDAILRLIEHDKDIAGVIYRGRQPPHQVWGADMDGEPVRPPFTGLREMMCVGGGLVAIKRRVLDAMPYPWREDARLEDGRLLGHDLGFCLRARDLGFGVYADLDLSREVSHHVPIGIGLS